MEREIFKYFRVKKKKSYLLPKKALKGQNKLSNFELKYFRICYIRERLNKQTFLQSQGDFELYRFF